MMMGGTANKVTLEDNVSGEEEGAAKASKTATAGPGTEAPGKP